jgi:hypothetical protein
MEQPSILSTQVVPLNNEEGLVVGWVSVVKDITSCKKSEAVSKWTERALQRERDRAQSYLDIALNSVWAWP